MQPPEVGLGDAVADASADREITLEQFKEQLRRIDQTLRALPATAQARPLYAALSRPLGCGFRHAWSHTWAVTPWPQAPWSCTLCARRLHDHFLPHCRARLDDCNLSLPGVMRGKRYT